MSFVSANGRLTRHRQRTTASPNHAVAALALNLAGERMPTKAGAQLTEASESGDGTVDLGVHVGRVCATLSNKLGVRLSMKTDEIWVDAARCRRVVSIVYALVREAALGDRKGRQGAIEVSLSGWGANVRCLVKDCRSTVSPYQGQRGQRVVCALAAQLGGSVEWRYTESGSFAGLHFSLDA